MIPTIFDILLYPTQGFIGIVGIVGLLKYKHLHTPLRILEWYIIFSFTIDIVKNVMSLYGIRTLWLSQCFSVIELLLFAQIYYYLRTSRQNGLFLWIAYIIYLIVWIVGKFTFEPFTYSDVYSGMVSQIIQIGFGGWILLAIMKNDSIIWKNDPCIWVVSGIVLYATAAFFLFGMFNVLLTLPRQIMLLIWTANSVFLIIQYSFFLRAFLCKPVNAGITNTTQTTYKE